MSIEWLLCAGCVGAMQGMGPGVAHPLPATMATPREHGVQSGGQSEDAKKRLENM